MLFCCLWRNVETSCHKHVVVVFRHQQTPPFATSDKCHNIPRSGGAVLITPGCRSVDSTRWSQILVGNSKFCLPHMHWTPPLEGLRRNIAVTFGTGKLEWCDYPTVKNFLKICLLVLTEFTNVTDRQADTARRHRLRVHKWWWWWWWWWWCLSDFRKTVTLQCATLLWYCFRLSETRCWTTAWRWTQQRRMQ